MPFKRSTFLAQFREKRYHQRNRKINIEQLVFAAASFLDTDLKFFSNQTPVQNF